MCIRDSINCPYDVTDGTTVSGGTVNFNAPVANLGPTLSITGGTVNFGASANPVIQPTTISVVGGVLNLNFIGTITLTTLTLQFNNATSAFGTINGTGNLTVTGIFTFGTGTTMSGTGITNAQGGLVLN